MLGLHKFSDEWVDIYGWGEEYIHSTNVCNRCNKLIIKKLS